MSITLHDLPEDILILITKYLDVIAIIRLRRVNVLLCRISYLLIVWVRAYKRSSLVLPPLDTQATSMRLERALKSAILLERRLASPSVCSRSGCLIPSPKALPNISFGMIRIVQGGSHVVTTLRNRGIMCVDVNQRKSWYLSAPHLLSRADGRFAAEIMVLDGRPGILVAYQTGEERLSSCVGYFQPTGDPCEMAYQIFEFALSSDMVAISIHGNLCVAGCLDGEVTVIDVETSSKQMIAVEGPVYDLAVHGQSILIMHAMDVRITAFILPLDDPLEYPPLQCSTLVPDSGRDVENISFSRRYHGPNSPTRTTEFTLNAQDRGRSRLTLCTVTLTLPSSPPPSSSFPCHLHPEKGVPPSIHCSAWADCANFGADFFLPEKMPSASRISTFGLESYTRHHVSMLIATHGSTTPLVLTRPGSEDEKGDMVTVKMGVHDPDLENMMWLSGRLAWDEVSGRLCVPSRDSDSIVVLEY